MKEKKRRKQFYNNKNRNQHWTEEPKGRPIDFADKYAENGGYSDKYDETKRNAVELAKRKKENKKKKIKAVFAVILAIIFVGVGYTIMDVHMIRQAEPAEALLNNSNSINSAVSQADLQLRSIVIDTISMDNSTMLDSVISDVSSLGLNSVTFDAKRVDGTIGYRSNLASVDTYGAISNAGSDSTGSIQKLIDNDILPVARICCYQDNVLPSQDNSLAAMDGDMIYADKDGNTFLNPNSDEVYNYIHDIIRELSDIGVQVFDLYGCYLPSAISDNYTDGYNNLVERLNEDFDGQVKFVSSVYESIDGLDSESGDVSTTVIESEIDEFDSLDENEIYSISSSLSPSDYIEILTEKGINNFILE